MIDIANRNRKPVRIGVNWGSLDQELLTRLMEENARLSHPKDAARITRDAMVQSGLLSGGRGPRNWECLVSVS